MPRIGKAFRRPPTGRIRDRTGGFPRLSDSVAHALRCWASRQRTLLAENLGKPSLWVIITDPWYKGREWRGAPRRQGGGGHRWAAAASAEAIAPRFSPPAGARGRDRRTPAPAHRARGRRDRRPRPCRPTSSDEAQVSGPHETPAMPPMGRLGRRWSNKRRCRGASGDGRGTWDGAGFDESLAINAKKRHVCVLSTRTPLLKRQGRAPSSTYRRASSAVGAATTSPPSFAKFRHHPGDGPGNSAPSAIRVNAFVARRRGLPRCSAPALKVWAPERWHQRRGIYARTRMIEPSALGRLVKTRRGGGGPPFFLASDASIRHHRHKRSGSNAGRM